MAMDVREKLVELLKSVLPNFRNNMAYWGEKPIYEFADCLLANGVTVQEWISVDDRLPEDRGYYLVTYRDKYNESTSIALDYYVQCGAGEWWANEFTHNITHWMPIPEPHRAEPITNADRIRSMTDEELAMCLYEIGYDEGWDEPKYALKWLQQPSEEG